jgi:hypothetical protein
MLIITGPTAAGKNTVGRALALRHARCAVVDFDAVRAMFVQPHRAPWQGDEGRGQQMLGVELACGLAAGFADAGWAVILLDVLSETTAAIYRARLARFRPAIVQLLPDPATNQQRFQARGPVLTAAEFAAVYAEQAQFSAYDLRIDNTRLAPEAVAATLEAWL